MAGKKWLISFLKRQPDIVVRKAENISTARATGMSREVVQRYFNQLDNILTENSLFDKPANVFNCDETGLQLNTRAGQVLAQKGSKCVASISPAEKGETISVLSCCNAEGGYLPPYCIFKGKNKKDEWADGMPPGSRIKMSEKSAYVNSDIFLDWLKTHFFVKKPTGKVLLILDGHSSHTTNLETLQFAEDHEIILFCLPPHTTHFLQPLDRCFFKSLKGYYYDACRTFVKNRADRKLSRLHFGKLLGDAWGKAATVQNALSGFRSTGIMPFNPSAIPDHAFLMECATQNFEVGTEQQRPQSPQPGPSGIQNVHNKTPEKSVSVDNITPGKALDLDSPVPVVTPAIKKARRQITGVLSSANCSVKKPKERNTKKVPAVKTSLKRSKMRRKTSSSSESDEVVINDSEDEEERLSDYENECVGCGEDYRKTKKKTDWIQCVICKRWLHETCTSYEVVCQTCGGTISKKK